MWKSTSILCSSIISVSLSLCFKKELCIMRYALPVMRYALCDLYEKPLFLNNLCLSVPLF